MSAFTPRRRRGIEYLDGGDVATDVRSRAIADVARSNAWLGGRRVAIAEIRQTIPLLGARATLLDVGTGHGDLPAHAARMSRRHGVCLTTIGLDGQEALLGETRRRLHSVVCGDALSIPVRNRSADIVLCSQLLHHFERDDALALLRELHRVARRRVIVSDLRRSWIAVGCWSAASAVLRFHPVTRHDGAVSILRGFTVTELRELVAQATGVQPVVRRHRGYRLTASWSP